jgi:hypothetical protein
VPIKVLDREVTEGLASADDYAEIVTVEDVRVVLEDTQPKLIR